MLKVFCGFALFALLCQLVLPEALSNLCRTMMLIYLGLAVVTASLGLLGARRGA